MSISPAFVAHLKGMIQGRLDEAKALKRERDATTPKSRAGKGRRTAGSMRSPLGRVIGGAPTVRTCVQWEMFRARIGFEARRMVDLSTKVTVFKGSMIAKGHLTLSDDLLIDQGKSKVVAQGHQTTSDDGFIDHTSAWSLVPTLLRLKKK